MTTAILERIHLLHGAEAGSLLRNVLDRCTSAGSSGLAVFDLDSTLLNNKPRQARIMREFGEQHRVDALRTALSEHWEGWDAKRAMANAGLGPDQIEEFSAPFRTFWFERFFTSEYCADDIPTAGAVKFVTAVTNAGVKVLYVTGRHEAMRAGTTQSFVDSGLPLPSDDGSVQLWMKPTFEEPDDAFKARTHARLNSTGQVIAAFDNEPAHINAYREAFPQAIAVHLATDHSPGATFVHEELPSIADFSALD